MPLLASASAVVQGKVLVEVCTVYGVAMVPLEGDPRKRGSDGAPAHGSEHCALTALGAWWQPEPSRFDLPRPLRAATSPCCSSASDPLADACASWAARLEHGPPAFA